MTTRFKIITSAALLAAIALFPVLSAHAFIGPTCSAGGSCGSFVLDESGNIGFGDTVPAPATSSPADANFGRVFTIASTSDPGISLKNLSQPNGRSYTFYSRPNGRLALWDDKAGMVRLFVEATGNVGIGSFVTGPASSTLSVFGNIDASLGISGDIYPSSVLGGAFQSANYAFPSQLAVGTTTIGVLPAQLYVNGTLRTTATTTLATNGTSKVGIGTTSPTGVLEVKGNSNISAFGVSFANTMVVNGTYSAGYSGYPGILFQSNDNSVAMLREEGNTGLAFYVGNASTGSTPKVKILTGGNVGIATTTPATPLSVVGTTTITGGSLDIATNGFGIVFPDSSVQTTAAQGGNLWAASATNISNTNSGNVGIATTTPAHRLTVVGDIAALGGDVLFADAATTNREYITSNDSGITGLNTVGVFGFFADASLGTAITSPSAGISVNGIYSAGSVGIGNGLTAPADLLSVGAGASSASRRAIRIGDSYALNLQNYINNGGSSGIYNNAYVDGGSGTSATYRWTSSHASFGSRGIEFVYGAGSGQGIVFYADSAVTTAGASFTPTARMIIQNNGNVGIATTTPAVPLVVEGGNIFIPSAAITSLTPKAAITKEYLDAYVTGGTQTGVFTTLSVSGTSTLATNANDRVGIGTTSPSDKLHVVGTSKFTDSTTWADGASRATLTWGGAGTILSAGAGSKLNLGADGDQSNIVIDTNGNVGIASSTPGARLVVEGGNIFIPSAAITSLTPKAAITTEYLDAYVTGGAQTGSFNTLIVTGTSTLATNANDRVGIGDLTPSTKLEVTGSGIFTSSLSATAYYDGSNYLDPANTGTSLSVAGIVSSAGAGNNYFAGNMGIGTASPNAKLDVNGVVLAGNALSVGGSLILAGQYGGLSDIVNTIGGQYSSGGTVIGYAVKPKSGASGYVSSADNVAWARGVLILDDSGFHVRLGTAQSVVVDSDVTLGEYLTVTNGGNVGIGTTGPGSYKMYVNGTSYFANQVTLAAGVQLTMSTSSNSINMAGGDILAVDKITATVIDPVYSIDGVKYSTYAADTIGLKSEMYGKARLKSSVINNQYSFVIDFAAAPVGSDTWLFWQTIDEGKDMKDVMVTLSPEFDGRAWYELRPTEKQIVIYAVPNSQSSIISDQLSVSYHLVAPRHDTRMWPNLTKDQSESPSFILNPKSKQ